MDRAGLARIIDHTLLTPEATAADVEALCVDAVELGVGAVCVSPSRLPLVHGLLPATTAVATVIGFPSGAHRPTAKAAEAAQAINDGATELDMVIDLGAAAAGQWGNVEAEVAAVCAVAPSGLMIKVIIESAWLGTDDHIVAACQAAESGGAAFVKTSTGFHKAGGASTHAVEVMAAAVGDRLGVKASGGIRDTATALAMVDAGATRLGLSASRAVLDGMPGCSGRGSASEGVP